MARHELQGGWVELRNPRDVPEKLRRPILMRSASMQKAAAAIAEVGVENAADVITEDTLESMFDFNDLVVVALVSEWSWGYPITVEGLGELAGGTYDQLRELVSPMASELMPNFETNPDPVSPTEPSSV